ncbi:MAG: lipid kinase [Actinomycetota bacterium]|nr:lipid kinase [Actinomycetota bacterium]
MTGSAAPTEPRFRRAALIVNTGSRTGKAAFDEARDRLTTLGVPLADTFPLSDAARLPETVHAAVQDGCDLVVLGGGDGTVSAAVDHLTGHDVALGVLPLGTANDFARTLQIPADLEQACHTVAHGKVVDVDLGLVEDNYFVNVASVGLSVAVTEALSPKLKARVGPLAYPVATLKAYRRHRPFAAALEFPDGDHEPVQLDGLLQVAVGNGRHYGGGGVVAPEAGIDDHALDVYAIRQGRLRDHVSIARAFKTGTFVEHANVTHLTTRRLRMRTDPQQHVNVDGEVVAVTPQEFSIARNALDVLVPQDSSAARQG